MTKRMVIEPRKGSTPAPELAALLKIFRCRDCRKCTHKLREYYMVHDVVWNQAMPTGHGMLCIGCLEKRLGRELHSGDFTVAIINTVDPRSERLRQRVRRQPPKNSTPFPLVQGLPLHSQSGEGGAAAKAAGRVLTSEVT